MDHAQLTTADFAQIDAGKALRLANGNSNKIDALAALLGYTPQELEEKAKALEEERLRVQKEKEEEQERKREEEFQASGLTREEFNSKKLMEMNIKNMKLVAEVDITEATHLRGYNPFPVGLRTDIFGAMK